MEKDNMVALKENWPLKGNSQMEFAVKSTFTFVWHLLVYSFWWIFFIFWLSGCVCSSMRHEVSVVIFIPQIHLCFACWYSSTWGCKTLSIRISLTRMTLLFVYTFLVTVDNLFKSLCADANSVHTSVVLALNIVLVMILVLVQSLKMLLILL